MKVTRNTPEYLILADTPWFLGIALILFTLVFVGPGLLIMSAGGENIWFGLLFAGIGGGLGVAAFCVFVRRVQVILDRPNNRIVIRKQSVFGYQAVEHELSHLSHAETERTTSSHARREGRLRYLYRPVLVLDQGMSSGHHPITETYSSGGGAELLVTAVNDWLPAGKA